MILKAIELTQCRIIVYFNSDILFHKNIITLIRIITYNKELYGRELLIVGKRGDIFWKNVRTFYNHDMLWRKCKLHSASGIDYFIFTRYTFSNADRKILNSIVAGRVRYDNIILGSVIKKNFHLVIDSTEYVKAIHLSVSEKEKNDLTRVLLLIIIY